MVKGTDIFVIKKGKMATILMIHSGKWMWIIMLIIMISAIITFAVTNDYRWLIVALMVFFIIIPMIAALFYIDKGFKPLTAMNANPHSLSLNDSEVVIHNRIPVYNDEDKNGIRISEYMIPYDEITSWKIGLNEIVFHVGGKGKQGILIVPASSFNRPEDFKTFIESLFERIRNQSTLYIPQ